MSPNDMTHYKHTHIDVHTRTCVRAHSTRTHTHINIYNYIYKYLKSYIYIYIKHAASFSLHATTGKEDTVDTKTEDRMNQWHHEEHAVAEWRTESTTKKKKRGKEGTLSIVWTNQRG